MTQTTIDLGEIVRTFYREVDANDPDVFARRFTSDGAFAFNDVDPVSGPDNIAGFVGAWKSNFASITHTLDNVIVDDTATTAGVEITVDYEFPDHSIVTVKGSSFLQFDGKHINAWRVYVDTSRLS